MNYARATEGAVWFRMKSTLIANDEAVPVPLDFDMTKLAEELEADKEEDRKQALKDQCTQVGVALIEQNKDGSGSQTDIGAKLKTLLGVGKSTAQSRLQALPVCRSNAHSFYVLGHKYHLWRENVSSDRSPRYIIHWGPAPKASAPRRNGEAI